MRPIILRQDTSMRSTVFRSLARSLVTSASRSASHARPVFAARAPTFFPGSKLSQVRSFSTTETAAKDAESNPFADAATPSEAPVNGAAPVAPEHERKIYVGNIAWKVQSQDLEKHFSQWGEVVDARVIMDRENPFRSRGFGFVTFSKAEDAADAAKMNNEKEWLGRNIRVNISSPRAPRENFGGGGSFGGGSGGYGGGRGQIRRDE